MVDIAKRVREKKPSIRARKYIQNKIAGMSDRQAALNAGYAIDTADAASIKIETPAVKKLLTDLMDERGLTDDKLLDVLQDGLTNSNKIYGSSDNFVEVPDHSTRHKYLETALKLKNKFPQVGDEENPFKVNLTIDIGTALLKIYGKRQGDNEGTGGVLTNS